MNTFQVGDEIILKPAMELTKQDIQRLNKKIHQYDFMNFKKAVNLLNTHGSQIGKITRTHLNDIYSVTFVGSPDSNVLIPGFLLKPAVNLTPETDAVFRDILRDV
jgi:hypothetical protein